MNGVLVSSLILIRSNVFDRLIDYFVHSTQYTVITVYENRNSLLEDQKHSNVKDSKAVAICTMESFMRFVISNS